MNEQEGRHTHTCGKEHSPELKLSHILLHLHKERKKGNKREKNTGMVERKNTHTHIHREKGLVALSLQVGWA